MSNQIASALDQSAAAMATGEEGPARVQFYQVLAEAELVLLLQREAAVDDLRPLVFDLPSGQLVLAFDSQERLSDWAAAQGQGALPYAALPGRVLAGLMAGQDGLSLGLNFGAGTASEMVLPHEAMVWLQGMLDVAPSEQLAQIAQVLPMGRTPSDVIAALMRGLLGAGGLAQKAVLARVQYRAGGQADVLAFFGVSPKAEAPLARAVAEALAFSGFEAAALDVIFVTKDSAIAPHLLRLGHDVPLPVDSNLADSNMADFNIPDPNTPAPNTPGPNTPAAPRAPGMNKDAPPKLR